MAMEYCHECDQLIDLDYNVEHFDKHNDMTKDILGLEGLVLSEIMPSLHYFMFRKGQRYQTGSDYTTKQLSQIIN